MIFIVICYYITVSSITPLCIGKNTDNSIYVNPHVDFAVFVIPILFFTVAYKSILRKIYVKKSILLGIISGVILLKFSNEEYETNVVNIAFLAIGLLCICFVVYIVFEIRTHSEAEVSIFSIIVYGITCKKKMIFAFVLMSVCIACFVYMISPKRWIYLYVDSQYSYGESVELNNDILVVGQEVKNIGASRWGDQEYNVGWKFYTNRSGNTQISISNKGVFDEEFKKVWDIYVDENMYVHHNMDYSYYVDVYIVYIILAVICTGLSLAFLLSGVKDILKNKKQRKIVNGAQ